MEASASGVSRETEQRLKTLSAMILRWNPSINLVAPQTLPQIRQRHIADSLQLVDHLPPDAKHWVDLGSGGGFPGLVVAACLHEAAPDCRMTLIESDQRKCVFLREAAREMGLTVTVLTARIEEAAPQRAEVVSARAVAPMQKLLPLTHRHLHPDGSAIYLKGQAVDAELHDATHAGWKFQCDRHTSKTDPSGTILVIRNLAFAHPQ